MTISKQALREAAEKADSGEWSYAEFNRMDLPGGAHININGRDAIYCLKKPVGGVEQSRAVTAFIAAFNPKVALALLNEVETAEHTAAVDHEAACSLVEENETLKRRIAEQREYYEGVIADGSKRIAELEKGHQEAAKQINSWRRLAKQNIAERGKDISELEAARQRIAEQSAIVATAEKLVRCKGRYHSELNYRALAALFGVNTPDLPPMDGESRTVMMPEPFKMAKSSSGLMYYYADEVDKALATAGIKVREE
ncbi:ead/Ea22-like family protein [Salmonella enterica]|nr:ead/Ea22-like family protein [Salmonella enterica]